MDKENSILYKDPEWIKYQHDVLGKTYVEIAKSQGVSHSTISHYKRWYTDLDYQIKYKEIYNIRNKKYSKRRDSLRKINNKNRKIKLYSILDPICVICGEKNPNFLTLDHLHNNGAEERKNHGDDMSWWFKKLGWPEDYIKENYQILCYNCNCSKGRRDYVFMDDFLLSNTKRYLKRLWKIALSFFGPCKTCGESDLRFLVISHIHNDGALKRKNGEKTGYHLLQHFNKLGWPESLKRDLCLECYNCNCSRQYSKV
jgi:hypothetical protein